MPERQVRQTHGVKLTYDDLLLLPDDGMRHELIDGEHYVTPAPNLSHQSVVVNVTAILCAYLEEHPIGDIFCAPTDVVFDPTNVVEPDVLYFSHDRGKAIFQEQHLTGAPELAVEVASPSTRSRDQTLKFALYERRGVVEYWFIEPDLQTVTVYRRGDGGTFGPPTVHRESSAMLTTDLLPDLQLPLQRIFKRRTPRDTGSANE